MLALLSPDLVELLPQRAVSNPNDPHAELRRLYSDRNVDRLREIAGTGDPRAQAWLGWTLWDLRKDDEASYWLTRAVEQEDDLALRLLAEAGRKEALPLLMTRAERNELGAMGLLVDYYEAQDDLVQAATWARRGAELGSPWLRYVFAHKLRHGQGVDADPEQSFRWYLAAASRKVDYAYLPLAELYDSGEGTARDALRAYAYADAALRTSDDSSGSSWRDEIEALKSRLAAELSPADRRAAEQLAAEIAALRR
jgi:TPR repeat protein